MLHLSQDLTQNLSGSPPTMSPLSPIDAKARTVTIVWDDDEDCFVAVAEDIYGCTGYGETIVEAAYQLQEALEIRSTRLNYVADDELDADPEPVE